MDSQVTNLLEQIKKETDIFNKAKLIRFLQKEKQIPLKKISEYLQIKPAYLCHILRLNQLPVMVIDGYYSNLISLSHLFVISRLKDEKKITEIYEKILKNNLTVSQTEELVREVLYGVKTTGEYLSLKERDNLIRKIKDDLENISIKIIQTRIKSKLIIEIKGSLTKTTTALRKLVEKIKLENQP
ncbi:MAG: hypothetical protein QHH09_04205 [Microgenomates group bacterium]|nr:hypothetical protein [Microgenomates group bacterium]